MQTHCVVRRTALDPHVGTQRQTGEARFVGVFAYG